MRRKSIRRERIMTTMSLELRSAHVPGDGDERCPLTSLDEDRTHVHGELVWTIGDRLVPHMGFWGPHDVCFGEWWDEFTRAIAALAAGQSYVHDSCEQGDPAFRFERSESSVCLSLVAGVGGNADPEWQRIEFASRDLVASVQRFKEDLRRILKSRGPPDLPDEWNERLSTSEK